MVQSHPIIVKSHSLKSVLSEAEFFISARCHHVKKQHPNTMSPIIISTPQQQQRRVPYIILSWPRSEKDRTKFTVTHQHPLLQSLLPHPPPLLYPLPPFKKTTQTHNSVYFTHHPQNRYSNRRHNIDLNYCIPIVSTSPSCVDQIITHHECVSAVSHSVINIQRTRHQIGALTLNHSLSLSLWLGESTPKLL